MHTANEQASYLNDYFAAEIWRPAADLLGNISLSAADEFVRTLPFCNGLQGSSFDFARPPSVTLLDQNTIRVSIPASGQHVLDTTIDITSPLPNAGLNIGFGLQIDASAGVPKSKVDVNVDFNWGGAISDAILWFTNQPAFWAKKAIEREIDFTLALILESMVRNRLSGTLSYRFDRATALQAVAGAPQVAGIFPASFGGSRDPQAAGYVDLLIVADGFDAGDVANFDDLAGYVAAYLTGAPERPFQQYVTDLRIWKLTLVSPNPADPLQRCIVPVRAADRATFNFSNLARIAEVGLSARAFFGRDPIVVFAAAISAADRKVAGVDLNASLRENTQGPFVLLNVAGISDADARIKQNVMQAATTTLIHELGHTPLGRYLADEYGQGGSPPKVYRGLEPRPRNVSTNAISGWAKWQPWSGSLGAFFGRFAGDESAYDFDRAIFRFAPDCRMRMASRLHQEFCGVCAEELTLGMLSRGHRAAGGNGVSGIVDLAFEFLSPFTQQTTLHLDGGGTARADVFAPGPGDHTNTRVRLTVVGSSVPQNWDVSWNVIGADGYGTTAQLTGNVAEFGVVPGSVVQLAVTHNAGTGLLGPAQPLPTTSVQIVFDRARIIQPADLQPPTNLTQSVPLGAVVNPIIDPATAAVRLPQPLWLQAQIGGVAGLDVPTSIGFQARNAANVSLANESLPGVRGELRRWTFDGVPPAGRYAWSGRTVWHALTSAWVQAPQAANGDSFEIGDLPFSANPQPPADPFDAQLLETATLPSYPSGVQATSWSPNDRTIKFQFELKTVDIPYDGQNLSETRFLDRDRTNRNSVAITGSVVFVNLFPRPGNDSDFFHWRVRAVDDRAQTSNWVEGRRFAIYLPAERPITVANLNHLIDELDRAVFAGGGGPIDIPRVYFVAQFPPGEKETNFSALDKWIVKEPRARVPERLASSSKRVLDI